MFVDRFWWFWMEMKADVHVPFWGIWRHQMTSPMCMKLRIAWRHIGRCYFFWKTSHKEEHFFVFWSLQSVHKQESFKQKCNLMTSPPVIALFPLLRKIASTSNHHNYLILDNLYTKITVLRSTYVRAMTSLMRGHNTVTCQGWVTPEVGGKKNVLKVRSNVDISVYGLFQST